MFDDVMYVQREDPVFKTTNLGLIGSGLSGEGPDDTMCIVLGARTPFLLRPYTEDTEGEIGKW